MALHLAVWHLREHQWNKLEMNPCHIKRDLIVSIYSVYSPAALSFLSGNELTCNYKLPLQCFSNHIPWEFWALCSCVSPGLLNFADMLPIHANCSFKFITTQESLLQQRTCIWLGAFCTTNRDKENWKCNGRIWSQMNHSYGEFPICKATSSPCAIAFGLFFFSTLLNRMYIYT